MKHNQQWHIISFWYLETLGLFMIKIQHLDQFDISLNYIGTVMENIQERVETCPGIIMISIHMCYTHIVLHRLNVGILLRYLLKIMQSV